jgi:energy-coupling factor transporter ATP-binding protein EcfA2
MTANTVAAAATGRINTNNPFPGLRAFEPHESSLFFGRDEQCDDLLTRLARRRLVAVVGTSGSGKSSLVRAGLLPALDRGYMPSAGSSWQIAIFRPGSDPLDNLARALAARRRSGDAIAGEGVAAIRAQLDASSLGLVAAARSMLADSDDSLLIVADQFEEIFRFSEIAHRPEAPEQAAACVDLLVNASRQDEVPVYVVITMRSDYLGDCAQFTGFPEALNDSQFLVPKMTRSQIRAAIESPIAVRGGKISSRLVQRLLHDVEHIQPAPGSSSRRRADQQYQDQLPLLQHALMRLWDVSRKERAAGQPIDLPHYEQPPVETLRHALDRHAEEVYQELPGDEDRQVARLIFQRLTDRDAENREVRRPTPLAELTTVASRRAEAGSRSESLVQDVIKTFSADGRAFVLINAQQDVDISHESFIRQWERLKGWVEEEHRSGRVYAKLADAASQWSEGKASLYRGPELVEARRWWQDEAPNAAWAARYGSRFDVAERFLTRSSRSRVINRALLIGNGAILLAAAISIPLLVARSARIAEDAALEVRNAAVQREQEIASAAQARQEAEELRRRAAELEAKNQGSSAETKRLTDQAEALRLKAQAAEDSAKNRQVLTPTELAELDRLRKQEAGWKTSETDLRGQVNALQAKLNQAAGAQQPAGLAAADRAELERLKKAEASWQQERTQLQQRPAGANDPMPIVNTLIAFAAAFSSKDLAGMTRLFPTLDPQRYQPTFSSFSALDWRFLSIQVSPAGNEATATAQVVISYTPLSGRRAPPPDKVTQRFALRRADQGWTIVGLDSGAAAR